MNWCNGKTKRIRGDGASASLMYHSRMRYLKSRDGSEQSKITLLAERGNGIMSSGRKHQSLLYGSRPKLCSSECLLPPTELMTRHRSFRHLYHKNNLPLQLRTTNFLQRKEKPEVVEKREKIFAKIRAAEFAAEKAKKEQEAKERGERRRSIINIESNSINTLLLGELSERSSGEETITSNNNENQISEYSTISKFTDGTNEDQNYGESFSFLSDWSKGSKFKQGYEVTSKNKNILYT